MDSNVLWGLVLAAAIGLVAYLLGLTKPKDK